MLTELVLSHLLLVAILAEDLSHRRYSALLSAQCKAQCLSEHRTAPLLSWPSTWQRCPRLSTCSAVSDEGRNLPSKELNTLFSVFCRVIWIPRCYGRVRRSARQ